MPPQVDPVLVGPERVVCEEADVVILAEELDFPVFVLRQLLVKVLVHLPVAGVDLHVLGPAAEPRLDPRRVVGLVPPELRSPLW